MKFSQLIWGVLVWAHRDGNGEALQAMEEYAAEHDGRLFISSGAMGDTRHEFVPHSISQY